MCIGGSCLHKQVKSIIILIVKDWLKLTVFFCLIVFVEQYFHPLQECKKQAEQFMKKFDFDVVQENTMQVTIEEDIEFIPVSEGTGWKIAAKSSSTLVRF